MSTPNENLYGFWKMTSMRFRRDDGSWESETVYGGSSIFTANGLINTFTRTSEIPFGYSGTFTVVGNDMIIRPIVCSITELEGKTILRTILEITPDTLKLGMIDDATGRDYEMQFRLMTRQFN